MWTPRAPSRNEADNNDEYSADCREHRVRCDAGERHDDVAAAIRTVVTRVDGDGLCTTEDQRLAEEAAAEVGEEREHHRHYGVDMPCRVPGETPGCWAVGSPCLSAAYPCANSCATIDISNTGATSRKSSILSSTIRRDGGRSAPITPSGRVSATAAKS